MPQSIEEPRSQPTKKNEAQVKRPKPRLHDFCVHEVFARRASLSPNALALVDGPDFLTYQQLNDRADHLANYLRSAGIGPGACVGIFADRSLEVIVAQLGILKSGSAYVPLDPEYPVDRLSLICKTTRIGMVLTNSASQEKWTLPEIQTVRIEDVPRSAPAMKPNALTPDDLAYVMYTSGSTGTPKGVMITHRGIVRLAFGLDFAKLDMGTVTLHLSPATFDASTFEIWGTLLNGGRCVIYPERIPSAARLGREIERRSVNTLWLTSSLFNTVVDEDPAVLYPIRQLLVGGEALSAPHVRRALRALPGTQIINGYGPTENTTFTCCYRVPRDLSESAASIPIGRPIGHTTVYVLDEHQHPAAPGTAGQLYTGGAGLARGYLNDPGLTAAKFIPNPFGEGRLYKTGDLVRSHADGNIEFLGRMDNQIKLRGFRIEPGEIENTLAAHPRIQRAAAVVHEDAGGDKQLVAYTVPHDQADAPGDQELRDFLALKLPAYMMPSRFVLAGALPLTATGKVDRATLGKMGWPQQAETQLAGAPLVFS